MQKHICIFTMSYLDPNLFVRRVARGETQESSSYHENEINAIVR